MQTFPSPGRNYMKAVLSAFDGVLAAEKAKGLDVTSPEPWQEELADISNPRMYVFMTSVYIHIHIYIHKHVCTHVWVHDAVMIVILITVYMYVHVLLFHLFLLGPCVLWRPL